MAAVDRGDEDQGGGDARLGAGDRDPLFRQAAEVCIQNQIGSTSLLQRRMSVGYGRAARIIDQLELAGILGPANGGRESTRLNSSHGYTSYGVFFLRKKNTRQHTRRVV